jgi:hypothetical protein
LGIGRTVSVRVTSWEADSVGTSLARNTVVVLVTSWTADSVIGTDEVGKTVRVGTTEVQFDLADSVDTVGSRNERAVIITTASQNAKVKVGIADESL